MYLRHLKALTDGLVTIRVNPVGIKLSRLDLILHLGNNWDADKANDLLLSLGYADLDLVYLPSEKLFRLKAKLPE